MARALASTIQWQKSRYWQQQYRCLWGTLCNVEGEYKEKRARAAKRKRHWDRKRGRREEDKSHKVKTDKTGKNTQRKSPKCRHCINNNHWFDKHALWLCQARAGVHLGKCCLTNPSQAQIKSGLNKQNRSSAPKTPPQKNQKQKPHKSAVHKTEYLRFKAPPPPSSNTSTLWHFG